MHKILIPSVPSSERCHAGAACIHSRTSIRRAPRSLLSICRTGSWRRASRPRSHRRAISYRMSTGSPPRPAPAGGTVVWIQNTITSESEKSWSVYLGYFADAEWGPRMRQAFTPGDFGHELYATLEVRPGDLRVRKYRFSALVQGASELDAILRARGIDTLIIVGTATNVCCESTARDAMMLNYKVFFVSDANACRTDEEHNATLAILMGLFADVRSTEEMIELLQRHAVPVAGAAE